MKRLQKPIGTPKSVIKNLDSHFTFLMVLTAITMIIILIISIIIIL